MVSTWRVVMRNPLTGEITSKVVSSTSQVGAAEKICRFYRRFVPGKHAVLDVYRVPACIRHEAESITTPEEPCTLAAALHNTLVGLQKLDALHSEYVVSLRKDAFYA